MVDEQGLPFNRSLNLSDYDHPEIAGRVRQLEDFRNGRLQGLFYRNDHRHRDWEYAEVLRKLETLPMPVHAAYIAQAEGRPTGQPTDGVRVLDTGFGCSYFTQFLKLQGYDIHASDSEAYGPVREKLIEQCVALGTQIPLLIHPVEDHAGVPSDFFDVALCISVIEHLPRANFEQAWRELFRLTKPGGYLFLTSDFFKDEASWLHSPALGIQHNAFMPSRMPEILAVAEQAGWQMVGTSDFEYRGDHVNDSYSFVTLTFQKPSAG